MAGVAISRKTSNSRADNAGACGAPDGDDQSGGIKREECGNGRDRPAHPEKESGDQQLIQGIQVKRGLPAAGKGDRQRYKRHVHAQQPGPLAQGAI